MDTAQAFWANGVLASDELFYFEETSPGVWEVRSSIPMDRLRVLLLENLHYVP